MTMVSSSGVTIAPYTETTLTGKELTEPRVGNKGFNVQEVQVPDVFTALNAILRMLLTMNQTGANIGKQYQTAKCWG